MGGKTAYPTAADGVVKETAGRRRLQTAATVGQITILTTRFASLKYLACLFTAAEGFGVLPKCAETFPRTET
jgi:hypothetical protein